MNNRIFIVILATICLIMGIMVFLKEKNNLTTEKNKKIAMAENNTSMSGETNYIEMGETNKYDTSSIPSNKLNYGLTIKDKIVKEKLKENGFVVIPNKEHEYLYNIYKYCKYEKTPVFVTSDSILHTSHLIFDWYLRYLEIANLRGDLINLTDGLLATTMSYCDVIKDKKLREAALKNAMYFTIGKQLLVNGTLKDIPQDIAKIIKAETDLIEGHKGFSKSPLMGYDEDYSQYVPRGHYNKSDEFKGYFKAMMWYGRIYFPIKEDVQTQQAILICKALKETKIKGEDAEKVWNRIYKTTAFFTGEADDLIPEDYKNIIKKVYGENISFEDISDNKKLEALKSEVKSLKNPKISSTLLSDGENIEDIKGLRFMGQRFTFDGYAFQNLTYKNVKEYTGKPPAPFTESAGVRGFARGLDLISVLGSSQSEEILKNEKDTDFNGYVTQMEKLKKEWSSFNKENYGKDLYNGRLFIINTLISQKDENLPGFMKTKAWKLKQINASLGSWTELKHDTILYSKEPYVYEQRALSTFSKGGPPEPTPTPGVVKGYVEPSELTYHELRLLFQQLRGKLSELNFPKDDALSKNLINFENLLMRLEEISKKELQGKGLTFEEYKLIEEIGSHLENILRFNHYYDISPEFQSEESNKMPIIADVLTEVNSKMVLEEATGNPFIIYAEIEIEKEKKICKGATYSYYEFKWPMKDRLTDENWRKILENSKEPGLPLWTKNFIIQTEKK